MLLNIEFTYSPFLEAASRGEFSKWLTPQTKDDMKMTLGKKFDFVQQDASGIFKLGKAVNRPFFNIVS